MTVADLVEGIEEWKRAREFMNNQSLLVRPYIPNLEQPTQEAEQKIKIAIREICKCT